MANSALKTSTGNNAATYRMEDNMRTLSASFSSSLPASSDLDVGTVVTDITSTPCRVTGFHADPCRTVKLAVLAGGGRGGSIVANQRNLTVLVPSAGHLFWFCDDRGGMWEFTEADGQIWRAAANNAFDGNGRRHGRWEAPSSHKAQVVTEFAN